MADDCDGKEIWKQKQFPLQHFFLTTCSEWTIGRNCAPWAEAKRFCQNLVLNNVFDGYMWGPVPSLAFQGGSYLSSWVPALSCQLENKRSIANPQEPSMNASGFPSPILTLKYLTTNQNCLCGYNPRKLQTMCYCFSAIEIGGTARKIGETPRITYQFHWFESRT